MRRTRARIAIAVAAVIAVAGAAPVGATAVESDPVGAGVFVDRVEGLADDFLMGVDVSTVLSLEESGVVFRDASGQPADLFTVLADHGVNSVRIRVWNDPFDASGQGYGGGNVDVARAVEMGQRATAAGMDVLVDFHYSDFWADPGRQLAPKAWSSMSQADKVTALHDFTADALQQFEDAGVDVGMVQIGNETNNAIAGHTRAGREIDDAFAELVSAGSAAVRDVLPDALVAVHFTNPETPGRYATYAAGLDARNVDYDVFASSYYPFWHGSTENLTEVLSAIAATYQKQVIVAETSWVRTLDDGDGHANVIGSAADASQYPISVQGQATELRDVIAAVAAVGEAGIGVYYWEPAWLPVGPDAATNAPLWERDGSGWATSAAASYDPVHVGTWYGGSAWDNQSLFAWDGTPLESLRTFQYVYTGAVAPLEVVSVEQVSLTVDDGSPIALPATVSVGYNDGSTVDDPVAWSAARDWIRGPGEYRIPGRTAGGLSVTADVEVLALNFVRNPGFEDADMSMWTLTAPAQRISDPMNASSGTHAVDFWSGVAYQTSVSQTLTGVPAGTYVLQATTHGTSSPASDVRTLTATTSAGTWSAPLALNGWRAFDTATVPAVVVGGDGVVEIRAQFSLSGNAWGVIDDVRLIDAASVGGDVDKTGLESALAAAAAVDRSLYSESTLADLDEAVAIGDVVVAGASADAKDVKKATHIVEKAVKKLKPIKKQ